MWVGSAKVQWASIWPSQTTTNSRKGNLFQYMVSSLDLVKFFGAVGPIYRGELLLNFVTLDASQSDSTSTQVPDTKFSTAVLHTVTL